MALFRLADTQHYKVMLKASEAVDAHAAIRAVLGPLVTVVEREATAPVRVGKVVGNQARVEASVFVDQSWRDGALLTATCSLMATHVDLYVSRSSQLVRGAVWFVLLGGLLGGLVLAHLVAPTFSGRATLVVGLAGGLSVGLLGLALLPRFPGFIGPGAAPLAAKLNQVVRAAMAQHDAGDGMQPRDR